RLVSPYEKNYCSLLYVAPDQSRALFFCFLLHRHLGDYYPPIKLKGINPENDYLAREINCLPAKKSPFGESGKTIRGAELIEQGIVLDFKNEYESVVVELSAE
ncbi:MAG: GH36 C-terminal domain-containing protein, partial [Chitinivibrionales bacterium]|nr:GH36 C-terminal domain-containing protein [Chitinivibrionales bacterium]